MRAGVLVWSLLFLGTGLATLVGPTDGEADASQAELRARATVRVEPRDERHPPRENDR